LEQILEAGAQKLCHDAEMAAHGPEMHETVEYRDTVIFLIFDLLRVVLLESVVPGLVPHLGAEALQYLALVKRALQV